MDPAFGSHIAHIRKYMSPLWLPLQKRLYAYHLHFFENLICKLFFWHSITPNGYYKKFCYIFWAAPPVRIHVVISEGPHKEPHKKKEHREMVMMLLMWHQFPKNLFP